MQDRSSRPKNSPTKTSLAVTKRCISLRMRLREGPVQLAVRVGVAPSTVHRILRSARLNRLAYLDRATGELVRRYEHRYPGSLVHVDVKKFGNIPDGGGWRYVGRRHCGRCAAPIVASLSNESYQTMAVPTARTCGAAPARSCPSPRSGPAPTDRKPTARSNASIAQWPTDGLTLAATPASRSVATHSLTGSTTTTTTGRTRPATTSRPSPD